MVYISLIFDAIGVGHAAWLIHYTYDHFFGKVHRDEPEGEKPTIMKYQD